MKKLLSLTLGLILLGAIDANAWWWKGKTIECEASYSFKLEVGPFTVEVDDKWTGTKTTCLSGEDWCFNGICS
jgi:hypothetical protein